MAQYSACEGRESALTWHCAFKRQVSAKMRAVLLLAALATAAALYDASDAVTQLDDKNFDKKTKEGVW